MAGSYDPLTLLLLIFLAFGNNKSTLRAGDWGKQISEYIDVPQDFYSLRNSPIRWVIC
jgi:hypothetical protein